jgi:ferritin-like metal-binding protein YciE
MSTTSKTVSSISTGTFAGTEESKHALATYISDAIAIERSLSETLSRQEESDDVKRFPDASRIAANARATADTHISTLEAQLDALGGHAASPVKSAWSAVIGAGSAAVESVRKTKVSKNLRDDYSMLSLASIGYEALHATALALGADSIAQLAIKHLDDYAKLIMEIGRSLPPIVLAELKDEELPVNESVAKQASENIRNAWSSQGIVSQTQT